MHTINFKRLHNFNKILNEPLNLNLYNSYSVNSYNMS